MNLLQEYKELYYKELEFKDSLNGKINTSISFLTILSTGHIFMWNIMVELSFVFHIIPVLFFIIEMISIYYTILSMYNFYKAYFKYTYYLVSIDAIKIKLDTNNSLINNYSKEEIDKANHEMMYNTFFEYTSINRKENLRKSKLQMKLSSSLIKAMITLMFSYTIWLFVINKMKF